MKQTPVLGQVLSQRQSAILAPQLQQGVRMLQLSSAELQEELELVLQQNLFLEKLELDADIEYSEPLGNQTNNLNAVKDQGRYESGVIQGGIAQPFFKSLPRGGSTAGKNTEFEAGSIDTLETIFSSEPGLHEYLRQQAAVSGLSGRQRFIMELLIDSINDRGYLRASEAEIVQLALPEYVITEQEVAETLAVLQGFDPVGVGARDSRECLLLQLEELATETNGRELAQRIIRSHLVALANGAYQEIAEKTGSTGDEINEAIELIRSLNPFPGDSVGPIETDTLVPDLIVKKRGGRWFVHLNPNVAPSVCLHHESSDLLTLAQGHEGFEQLKQTFQEARVFVSSIEKRYRTILDVARVMIERQPEFMDQGEAALRPMTQKEIAEVLDLHVSTISRAVNEKYILTPLGVLELKALFCSGLALDGGGRLSSRAIESRIRKLIEEEPDQKPLSDSKIAEMLGQQGIQVARRTVMKYRERLGIAASPVRRRRSKR